MNCSVFRDKRRAESIHEVRKVQLSKYSGIIKQHMHFGNRNIGILLHVPNPILAELSGLRAKYLDIVSQVNLITPLLV